jgi:diacylglycerol kinase (ATP)
VTRALLITNPVAARHAARALSAIRTTLRAGGWEVEVRATAAPGDARRFATEARASRVDVVVCHGGDGTAMQAAAGLVGSGIPLGVVPGGTGNILARNLRLPQRPVAAARALLAGRPLAIDLGVVERADGPHYFAVCSGAGFDADVMRRTEGPLKQRWRMGAYFARALSALPDVRSAALRITVDGVVHEVRAAVALVANCGELFPPFFKLHRDVWPNDGWFDLVTLRADGAVESVSAFLELLRGPGNGTGWEGAGGRVWHARGRTIRVEVASAAPLRVQLDGEVVGETPFEARLLPGALRVLVDPATVPGGMPADG